MNTSLNVHHPGCALAAPGFPMFLLGLFVFLQAASVSANLRVETLQMPAWLERAGVSRPLTPGADLQAGDVLRTGGDARVVLRLDEGSQVKLGENAQFSIEQAAVEDDQWGLFRGLFEVVSGAFRFTTGKLGAQRRRDVNFRIGLTTAGIRGTDIWGRSTPEQDLVCLIEGDIEISRAATRLQMNTPLSVFIAPRAGEPQPLSGVDPVQLAEWAQETEPQTGSGLLRLEGKWSLQLAALRSVQGAQSLVAQLRDAGYAAGVVPADINGQSWQRLVIVGFVSEADARAAGDQLRDRFNLPPGWVTRLP